jgi:uncharacterized membrane protein
MISEKQPTGTAGVMLIFYLSISLTVISNVLYHIFQKLIPQGSNPAITLCITYATSLLTCMLYLTVFPPTGGLAAALHKVNWTSAALGIAIIGLEAGYLLAYRAGWNISTAGIVSAAAVALVLIPIGLAAFKERLSALNALGVVLCLAGLILVNWKK